MFLEKRLKRKEIYRGKAVSFRVDEVELPNGKKAAREFMVHPGAVAVLPVIGSDSFVFVKQYRYPVGEVTFEIPAGKLNFKGDSFIKRARAELKEETGYTASKFVHLIDFWPTPAFSTELLRIYLALGLKKGKVSPDDDEFLDVVIIKESQALEMIKSGKIKDSKTIIAILYYFLNIKREGRKFLKR